MTDTCDNHDDDSKHDKKHLRFLDPLFFSTAFKSKKDSNVAASAGVCIKQATFSEPKWKSLSTFKFMAERKNSFL